MKRQCNTELKFNLGGKQFVVTHEYKDGLPLLFWYNVAPLTGGVKNVDVRDLGHNEDTWVSVAMGKSRIERLRLVRDILKANQGARLKSLFHEVMEKA